MSRKNNRRTWPRKFHERYCERTELPYGGADVDGTSIWAKTELPARLSLVVLKRTYKECWGNDAPPKIRTTNWIDSSEKATKGEKIRPRAWTNFEFEKESDQVLQKKLDQIVDDVAQGLVLGQKRVVWAYERSGVEILTAAFDSLRRERSYRAALAKENMEVFATHGETKQDVRVKLAAEFREHKGAAVFIANYDSLPEAASLKGADGVDCAQLHREAGTLVQSENRAYHPDVVALPIVYHVLKGSFEERMIKDLLPRVEVLAKVAMEEGAESLLRMLDSAPKETVEDYMARLFGNMPVDTNGASFGEFDESEVQDQESD